MTLTVTGRHMTVSAASRRQIDARIRRIQRLLGKSAVSAQCTVWQERATFVCELRVHAGGDHRLNGLGRDSQLAVAVANAVEKVATQAARLKDRWKTRRRAAGPATRRIRGA
jgi:ribosomal subunit interface protein